MEAISFFKNLADETRLKILLHIHQEQELCVCELTQALDLSQPKISRHIAQLRREKLLVDRREGKWVFYSLSKYLPTWQQNTIELCFESSNELLIESSNRLNQMGNRPQRQKQCCN